MRQFIKRVLLVVVVLAVFLATACSFQFGGIAYALQTANGKQREEIRKLPATALEGGKLANYGGTNHFLYATGDADVNNTDNSWYIPPLNIRPVVGTYHHDPALVRSQMAAAKASDQSVYVLPIYTKSLAACETTGCSDGLVDDVWGEVINYEATGLSEQHQDNLKSILNYASQLGFKRMIIRFIHYDSPHYNSGDWEEWNEETYQKIWNYVKNTRNLAANYLDFIDSSMELLFDLGAEYGGLIRDYNETVNVELRNFDKRLWKDYTGTFTNADTIGFSIAYADGRFTRQKQWYGRVLPKWWAFDIYPEEDKDVSESIKNSLESILEEMGPLRNQPIIFLETLFNDSEVSAGIQEAMNANPLLNIDQVSQWTTGDVEGHFWAEIISSLDNPDVVFNNYLPLIGLRAVHYTSTNANIMGIADVDCSTSASLPCSITLMLGTPPSEKQNVLYVSAPGDRKRLVGCYGDEAEQPIPWIGTSVEFSVYQTDKCSPKPPPHLPAATSTLNLDTAQSPS